MAHFWQLAQLIGSQPKPRPIILQPELAHSSHNLSPENPFPASASGFLSLKIMFIMLLDRGSELQLSVALKPGTMRGQPDSFTKENPSSAQCPKYVVDSRENYLLNHLI
ncbi:predicted protein [Histoplasma capsulatum var. duboisii H88]|uniref:Predicted protein n=1 Tax=Ajellomyces capsulatus (strain H88) TaxID=544711 RepID=F0UGE0_AJEC8|nr:predicted protein [Histoplasma capsulatum var. duboisii H88]